MRYQAFSFNSEFFERLIEDMEKAKSRIYLETYIFREDELGKKIKAVLTEKARKGVAVKLLIDAVGSLAVSEFNFYDLISAGGDVKFFRRLLLAPFHLAKLNNRNHRKTAVIDNNVSYIGSANIDRETSSWREFNVRLEGSRFNEIFSKIFIQQFVISNSLSLNIEENKEIYETEGIKILRAVPFVFHPVRDAFLEMISEAEKEIVIENPYVVFDREMHKRFKKALKRGVEIKMILPTRSDLNLMNYVNIKHMRKARKAGMKIYLYPGMLHSKIVLVDKNKWMFGSANLEYRSMFTQFEIMLKGNEGEIGRLIAGHISESFSDIEKRGREFKGEASFKEKLIGNLLYPVKFLF